MPKTFSDYSLERRDKLDVSKNRLVKTTYIKIIRTKNNKPNLFRTIFVGLKFVISLIGSFLTIKNLN